MRPEVLATLGIKDVLLLLLCAAWRLKRMLLALGVYRGSRGGCLPFYGACLLN